MKNRRPIIVIAAGALALSACAGDADTTETTADLGLGDITTTTAVVTPETTVDTGDDTLTDDTMTDDTMTDDTMTDVSIPESVDEAITELQGEFEDLANSIAESDASEELLAAFAATQSEILEALAAVQAGEALDTTAIEDALDRFTADIPDTEADVQAAWAEVQDTLERLFAELETTS